MTKSAANVFSWVGAGITLCGAAFFVVVRAAGLRLGALHHAVLLWTLGAAILCYAPRSGVSYREAAAEDPASPAARAARRSFALKIILGTVLLCSGVSKIL